VKKSSLSAIIWASKTLQNIVILTKEINCSKNTSKYSDFDKRNKLLKLKKVSGMLS